MKKGFLIAGGIFVMVGLLLFVGGLIFGLATCANLTASGDAQMRWAGGASLAGLVMFYTGKWLIGMGHHGRER